MSSTFLAQEQETRIPVLLLPGLCCAVTENLLGVQPGPGPLPPLPASSLSINQGYGQASRALGWVNQGKRQETFEKSKHNHRQTSEDKGSVQTGTPPHARPVPRHDTAPLASHGVPLRGSH